MYLFLLFFTPLVYVFYNYACTSSGFFSSERRLCALIALAGLFSACVICGFCSLFVFSTLYTGTSFAAYLFFQWFIYVIQPFGIFYGLFLLFSKDSWEVRLGHFLHFVLPFYSVYLPFETISRMDSPSLFLLFFRPLLCLSVCVFLSLAIARMQSRLSTSRVTAILILLSGLVLSVLPFVFESLWYYQYNFFLWFLPTLLFSAAPLLLLMRFPSKKLF